MSSSLVVSAWEAVPAWEVGGEVVLSWVGLVWVSSSCFGGGWSWCCSSWWVDEAEGGGEGEGEWGFDLRVDGGAEPGLSRKSSGSGLTGELDIEMCECKCEGGRWRLDGVRGMLAREIESSSSSWYRSRSMLLLASESESISTSDWPDKPSILLGVLQLKGLGLKVKSNSIFG
ncbi:hypothetical protein B0J18DRAFT_414877 [Chaetomium sp. MPI-SDFR-AT-0129]|nr:hypothetical protein B0J18DRAFT_414877 [Chaetomium sp. MPI-SDFR-AT-0129]